MQIGRSTTTILATVALVLIVALVVGRTIARLEIPGHPELPRYGMQDFRDSIYYPVRTLLAAPQEHRRQAQRHGFVSIAPAIGHPPCCAAVGHRHGHGPAAGGNHVPQRSRTADLVDRFHN